MLHRGRVNHVLTKDILCREFAAVIGNALDMDTLPSVAVEMAYRINDDGYTLRVMWPGVPAATREIPGFDLLLSLDHFSARHVVPMVSDMCGRPMLDERGRIVINPVHDMREAA